MTREMIGFLMISMVAVIALLIWLSTIKHRRQQESVIATPVSPTSNGEYESFYVSTVLASQPLERVWAHGLGMRGKAILGVDDNGISVFRTGETGFLIPKSKIEFLGAASATIDKGVERNGLVAIAWFLGDTSVVTHFRFTKPEVRKEFENKVSQLIGAQIG